MSEKMEYQEYLENPDFVKHGIVTSSIIWGKSHSEIAKAFSVSKQYVSKVLIRWKEDQFSDKRVNNGGCNRKITPEDEQSMISLIENERTSSLKGISESLKEETGLSITPQAIGKALKAIGYIKSKPYKVPSLSSHAITKRMEYATYYLEDKFSNVVFSDESMFQLSDNRHLYWWNPNTEERPVFEDNYNKSKIMIWGGISRRGKTDIFFWKVSKDLKVNAQEYIDCLDETLFDKMDALYGFNRWRFLQDNAGPHTAKITQAFLADNNIRTVIHPPYSPDLNPIELIWAYLKHKVMDRVYDNLDEVLDRVVEEWEAIPKSMLNNLIDAHCERVQEVFDIGGRFY